MDRRDAIIAGAGLGLGGLMAARPDQQYYPAAGGAQIPGSRTGKIRANQVIITGVGPNAGLFVYNGTPALGNPPVFAVVAPGVVTDPFGNAVVSIMTAGNLAGAFTQIDGSGDILMYNASGSQVIVVNPIKQAMLIYSPSAGAGNLICSVAAVGGTDAFGNTYNQGVTAYGGSQSVEMQGGRILFVNSPEFQAGIIGMITAISGIDAIQIQSPQPSNLHNAGQLNIISSNTLPGGIVQVPAPSTFQANAGAAVAGGTTTDTLAWSAGATGDKLILSRNGGAPLLDITDLANASTAVIRVTVPSGATQQIGFSELISGDANGRLVLDLDAFGNPRIRMGSGSSGADTNIYRASANLFASDYIAFDAGGSSAESWQVPTFANGWANAITGTGLEYRRVAAPAKCVQWAGRIVAPAGIVSGQAIIAAVPTAYRPQAIGRLLAANTTSGNIVQLQMELSGTLTYRSGAVAGDNIDLTHIGNLVALDA